MSKKKSPATVDEVVIQLSSAVSEAAQLMENLVYSNWDNVDNLENIYSEMQWINYNLRKIQIARKIIWRKLLAKMRKEINTDEEKK